MRVAEQPSACSSARAARQRPAHARNYPPIKKQGMLTQYSGGRLSVNDQWLD